MARIVSASLPMAESSKFGAGLVASKPGWLAGRWPRGVASRGPEDDTYGSAWQPSSSSGVGGRAFDAAQVDLVVTEHEEALSSRREQGARSVPGQRLTMGPSGSEPPATGMSLPTQSLKEPT